jgi:hypothetical protein
VVRLWPYGCAQLQLLEPDNFVLVNLAESKRMVHFVGQVKDLEPDCCNLRFLRK